MDKKDSGIDISDKLLFLCENNQLNKIYDVKNSIYSHLLLDMYESDFAVFEYPADCNKAYERSKTQKTIAKHINGTQKATISWIMDYCKFFGCSADYMLGIIDQPTKELTDIHNATGLTTKAIKGLLALKNTDNIYVENGCPEHQLTTILNDILSLNNGLDFELIIESIRQYLLSDYLIPCTHTKGGKPIISESEHDYYDMGSSRIHLLTLLRSEDDKNDSAIIPLTKDFIETYAMDLLKKRLSETKENLKK